LKANWQKWEEEVAKNVDGVVMAGSGNQWFAKSDVRNQEYRFSCKQTDNDSFSIKRSDWREIWKIGMEDSKAPVVAVNMNGIKLAVLDWDDFLEIMRPML